jgi:hypothetical protein
MATIAKNRTKRVDEIFATVQKCEVFTLENYFRGQECDKKYAREALDRWNFAKLTDNGNGYTVHVHSNCWYDLS